MSEDCDGLKLLWRKDTDISLEEVPVKRGWFWATWMADAIRFKEGRCFW